MSATMDIIVSAQDKASDVIEGVADSADGAASWIEQNWAKVTAATATAGAASEGFARSQADTNAVLGRSAARTGETEDSLRGMINGMVDATFSAHDAAAGMEALGQRGVNSRGDLERLLPVFDDFSDATGTDMVKGIDQVTRVLGAFNIPAADAGDHIDTMTFMANELGIPMDRLGRQLANNADELDGMNIGVDESAAFLAALRDRGMDGRDAMKTFTDAVKESDGDLDTLLDTLGMTAAEYEQYQQQVADASGITSEHADISNSTMTVMERMQQNLENLMFRYGGLAEAAGMAAPVLIAVGPAMKAMSMAAHGATAAVRALAAAKLTLLGPIALVVAAVAAVITIGVLLVKNWDEISAFLVATWEKIREVAVAVWESITGFFSDTWAHIRAFFSDNADRIKTIIEVLMRVVLALMTGGMSEVVLLVVRNLDRIRDTFTAVWNAISGFLGRVWAGIRNSAAAVFNAIRSLITSRVNAIRDTITAVWNAVSGFLSSIWGGISSTASSVWSGIRTVITNPVTAARDFIIGAFETVRDRLAGVWDGITGGFSSAFGSLSNLARSPINAVIGVINSFIRRLNSISVSIPDVPGVPGRGTNVGFNVSTIPRLAEGGIVRARPGGMLALIGEGGQDEAVVPLGPDDPFGEILTLLREQNRLLKEGHGHDVWLDRDHVGRAMFRGFRSR